MSKEQRKRRWMRWLGMLLIGATLLMAVVLIYYRFVPGWNVYEVDEAISAEADDCAGGLIFASIGDFGDAGWPEAAVAQQVHSWEPSFIFTVGDNNYPRGEARTIDRHIGQYYQAYIYPYVGEYGRGSAENRFFPALGNHDWMASNAQPYFDYFTLPGNERYYDVVRGPVHLFIVNSNIEEPDGISAESLQAAWLHQALSESDAPWKLVAMHHPPYSSSINHGSQPELQWPYAAWGADAVFAGHDHTYERAQADGIPYFVNGLGGRRRYKMGDGISESVVRYNRQYGAMRIEATESCINFSFIDTNGDLVDSVTLRS